MFLDASAVVAVLNEEPEGASVKNAIAAAKRLTFSPAVRFEAALALARAMSGSGAARSRAIATASASVDMMMREIDAEEIAITPEIGRLAIEAAAKYGRAVGHRAGLNFGDCLAYACAKIREEDLLFVGDDFPHTDIVAAIRAN